MIVNHARFAITVDVEGEWFNLPGEQGTFDVSKVIEAVQNLEQLFCQLESKVGIRVPVTWFIRCDDSVSMCTGDCSGLLKSLNDFILRRKAMGDEFGFHPHLYKHSQGKWMPETDCDKQSDQLKRGALAWKSYFGSMPSLSRIGEALMNNAIAKTLDELGIEIDSTALEGRKRSDQGFHFDWVGTPNKPYYPSTADYRRPPINGECSRNFIEIPFTMLPLLGPNDKVSLKRYFNLAFKPELMIRAIETIEQSQSIVAVLHPHELLPNNNEHPLIAYSPNSLEKNIKNLCGVFEHIQFKLLSELSDNAFR